MNELFVFDGNEVEIFNYDGEILFNPKDVGKCLDISGSTIRDHIRRFNENQVIKLTNKNISEVGLTNFRKLNNAGENFLKEAGVYKLIFKSRKPDAEKFQDWVTDEVLPQIRMTGGYIPTTQEDDEETILAKAFLIAQRTIEKKNKLIKEMTPRVNWFDKFMSSEGLYTSTQVAKVLHISSAKKLNTILNEEKIIYKQGVNWLPYVSTDKSWYKLIVGSSENHSYSQLKFTPKGIYEISKILDVNLKEEDVQSV